MVQELLVIPALIAGRTIERMWHAFLSFLFIFVCLVSLFCPFTACDYFRNFMYDTYRRYLFREALLFSRKIACIIWYKQYLTAAAIEAFIHFLWQE